MKIVLVQDATGAYRNVIHFFEFPALVNERAFTPSPPTALHFTGLGERQVLRLHKMMIS